MTTPVTGHIVISSIVWKEKGGPGEMNEWETQPGINVNAGEMPPMDTGEQK
ncbi:hypothetical protein [Methanogenium sp. MK-MG]|uniref:hypothetical protein n=1 Tax=Methanogenium sp. MK-MG TaxID=2599926 RepID=UPI0013EC203C|nr:hypothetical protein [Methanogenium sp. MK-MG]